MGDIIAISDDLITLRNRALEELADAHDYYANTKTAWRIVRRVIQAERNVTVKNKATGNEITGAVLAARSRVYVSRQLTEATFQQFHSIFEDFVLKIVRHCLTANPKSLSEKMVKFATILGASDLESIRSYVIDKEADDVLRGRPADWFAYLKSIADLGCPTPSEVSSIAEARASRDVLVHNGGVVGKVYTSKAGNLERHPEGERLEVDVVYHRATWDLFRKVVTDLSDAAAAKIA